MGVEVTGEIEKVDEAEDNVIDLGVEKRGLSVVGGGGVEGFELSPFQSVPVGSVSGEGFTLGVQDLPEKVASEVEVLAPDLQTAVEERFPNLLSSEVEVLPSQVTTIVEERPLKVVFDAGNGASTSSKPIAVYRRSNPRRDKSLRSNLADKSMMTPKARKVVNGCSNATENGALVFDRVVKRTTRKRSSRRAGQRPDWGAVEQLVKQFEHQCELAGKDCSTSKEQRKTSKRGISGKQQLASSRELSSQGLKVAGAGSSDSLRLKDKMSRDPLSCALVELQPSGPLALTSSETKTHAGNAKSASEVGYNSNEQTCGATVKPLQCDLEKDLESTITQVTQEENMLVEFPGVSILSETGAMVESQNLPPRAAWVLCDDCEKWRCIPPELADIIEQTNRKWTCKDNKDNAFADCSIPQEKTDEDINAELELSDGDDVCDAQLNIRAIEFEPAELVDSSPDNWTLIKSNLFLHRHRKSQTIDEIMVCICKPPLDGNLGCGEECLNRMLNIECVRGTCPCGDLCSNQQFQKRKYAKFERSRCGKKGHGLELQERVSEGQFLIEYVGEVLDVSSYEARQRAYASMGQQHFYFMTLNAGEVIDACTKGNLGRFINHSCDPNCRTEKWMVNGEVCVGLFAIRDIKKGEEVTFNYQYVRVFGAAAKKCFCGAANCRGYIGGDPSAADVIVQVDSDEEYPEPLMIHRPDEDALLLTGTVSPPTDAQIVDNVDIHVPSGSFKKVTNINKTISRYKHPKVARQVVDIDGTVSDMDADVFDNSSHSSNSIQNDETMCRPPSNSLPLDVSPGTSSISEPATDSVILDEKSNNVEVKLKISKPRPRVKSSIPKDSMKKTKPIGQGLRTQRAKQVPITINTGQMDRVEDTLDGLVDEHGGISTRKGVSKVFLKLLFVTAAEGDNFRGFASQSTRDLSLILDVLLKTKSRGVLVDLINKNGLQMLHNIMKQNRNDFKKLPILRKLLKVLDFLEVKGILTREHIVKSPCSGMESFEQSMLFLTKHSDRQVHDIARKLRDKWNLHTIRRGEQSGSWLGTQLPQGNWHQSSSCRYGDQRTGVHVSSTTCQSYGLEAGSNSMEPVADNNNDEAPPGFQRPCKNIQRHISDEILSAGDAVIDQPTEEDEGPPGFDSQRKDYPPRIYSNTSILAGDVVVGTLQEKYLSHLSVSYGMPVALVQQLGTPYIDGGTPCVDGGSQCRPCWEVAPGIVFHPFPPLPLYSRVPNLPSLPPTSSGQNLMSSESKEDIQLSKEDDASPLTDLTSPTVSRKRSVPDETGACNSNFRGRGRSPFHVSGGRCFRASFNNSRGRFFRAPLNNSRGRFFRAPFNNSGGRCFRSQRWGYNRFERRSRQGEEENLEQWSQGYERPLEEDRWCPSPPEEQSLSLSPEKEEKEERPPEEQSLDPCPQEDERPPEEQRQHPCPQEAIRGEKQNELPCQLEMSRTREEHSQLSRPQGGNRPREKQSQQPSPQEEKSHWEEQIQRPGPQEEIWPREERIQRLNLQEEWPRRELSRHPSSQEKERPRKEQGQRTSAQEDERPRKRQNHRPSPQKEEKPRKEQNRRSCSQEENRPREEHSWRLCPRGETGPWEEQSWRSWAQEENRPREEQSRHLFRRGEKKGPREEVNCLPRSEDRPIEEQSRHPWSHGNKRPCGDKRLRDEQNSRPWPREGNNAEFKGRTRNGASSKCIGNKRGYNDDGFCLSEGVSNGKISTKYHQRGRYN